MKIFLASRLVESHGLIIESDLANAVKWCNGENNSLWNLVFHINLVRSNLKSGHGISVVYKSRETNVVAYSLAKQGLLRLDDFMAWL